MTNESMSNATVQTPSQQRTEKQEPDSYNMGNYEKIEWEKAVKMGYVKEIK